MGDPHGLVGPYALDALDVSERRAFERHLAVCDACWAEVTTAMETARRLEAVRPPIRP